MLMHYNCNLHCIVAEIAYNIYISHNILDMNKKILAVLIVLVLVIIYFFVVSSGVEDDAKKDTMLGVETIEVVDNFQNGTHSLSGKIMMPTPCHALSYDLVILKNSYPEEVEINFSGEQMAEICASVITPFEFKVDVDVSEDASFQATYEGRELLLDISEPAILDIDESTELDIVDVDDYIPENTDIADEE